MPTATRRLQAISEVKDYVHGNLESVVYNKGIAHGAHGCTPPLPSHALRNMTACCPHGSTLLSVMCIPSVCRSSTGRNIVSETTRVAAAVKLIFLEIEIASAKTSVCERPAS